ncbi:MULTISPECIES: 3-hydroxyacyl-CoA dehydrogenase NAD-binding domain-containing protein [Acidobacteriaceae]|uniref:3-hydroxyacyl-CoA dehydrogenase NAD-binding domain-containing protein n=1 Tax=Acidobacteriaceae TaxID=204434 RepID=UPI00131E01A7|nr:MULTISPECIES: 3-hydroxyacyl-CoA dehydrogenase NAD-binding domain-containing protein [Acidobacteriaceae]MDW5266298.1 3-hydroxyacyl-CoA dehydrogenase NAD-binding domain-containing protein [Edaphobacter sp.]
MQPAISPSPFEIRTVAVIGAGTAGRSFALACVAAGFHVVLEDVMPANLRRAEADFAEMDLRDSPGSLDLALTVEDAVRVADIAVDFVPDELESKLEIFSMVDRMAPPKTILCTPSDALSITDLASCVYRPERCFAVRGGFTGVAGLGSAVRLLYPASADAATLAATGDFLRSLRMNVQNEPDPDVPVLMKNQTQAAS